MDKVRVCEVGGDRQQKITVVDVDQWYFEDDFS